MSRETQGSGTIMDEWMESRHMTLQYMELLRMTLEKMALDRMEISGS